MTEEELLKFQGIVSDKPEDPDPEQSLKENTVLEETVNQQETAAPKGDTVTLADGKTYETADLEYVNGNPFVKPEARAKYEEGGAYFGTSLTDLNDNVRETLSAPGAGVADTLIGTYNMVTPGPDFELPQFEQEGATTLRNISSIVLPGMGISKAIKTTGTAYAATKAGRFGAFLRDPAVAWLGGQASNLGGGAVADLFAPSQSDTEGQTLLGSAKEALPRWFGWVPDNLVVLEGDSPDVVRGKNMLEGTYFGGISSLVEGMGALFRGVTGLNSATKYIPKNEQAGNYFAKNQPIVTNDPSDVVDASSFKRSVDLDELGEYNTYKTVNSGLNPEETIIFGKDKDLFSPGESGIRSTDEMGIVGDAVDLARINMNIDTIYGRLRNPMSEAALKFTLDGNEVVPKIMQSLGDQLKAAGDFDYSTTTGKLISNTSIKDAGDRLAADMLDMTPNQLKSTLKNFLTLREGLPALNKTGSKAVNKTIKDSLQQLADLDQLKAYAYVDTAFSGQVSDFAQGIRLADGGEAMLRAQEQMIDRLEYLMDLRGTTAYARNSFQRANSVWQQLTGVSKMSSDQKYAKKITEQLKGEFDTSLEALEAIQADTKRFMDSLRNVAAERPNFLKPMATVYELTDGDARSVAQLNHYLRNRFGVLKKAFVDGNPEIPSVVMEGFWATAFNSALSGLKTPIKAGVGNLSTWVFKPSSQVIGAFLNGNTKQLDRAFYSYGNVMDTMSKSGEYAKQMWRRSAQDPYALRGRDELLRRSEADMDLLKQTSDAAMVEGNDGPAVLYDIVKTQKDLAEHPWLRIGNRTMGTEDAWLTAVNGQMISRTRAWDEVTKGGKIPFDKELADKAAKVIYNGMFDETGIIRDSQVLRQTAQATFSQNNALSTGFQDMMGRIPLLRPFFMFTRTPVNSLSYGASFEPVGMFIDKVNKFEKPFEQMPAAAVERLLKEEGIDTRISNPELEYTRLRDEYKGRSAMGASFVMLGVYGYLSGNITGRAGLYDRKKQQARRKLGWKPMTAFGVDYSQIPAVSDWLSLTIDMMDNAYAMEPNDVGEGLRTMAYVIGANIFERTQLQNIEQFSDVLSGNPAAIQRWSSNQLFNAQTKVGGMLGTMNSVMAPQLKAVENHFIPLFSNRLPGKPGLEDQYDAIDGGLVNELGNPLHRLYNAISPFPFHEKPSEAKDYLTQIEYPFELGASTRYDGTTYSKTEQAYINRLLGEDGYFKKRVLEIKKDYPANKFRADYKAAKDANLDPSTADLDNVHNLLDLALETAKARAEAELPALMKKLEQESNKTKIKKEYVKRNDSKGGKAFMESMQQQSY